MITADLRPADAPAPDQEEVAGQVRDAVARARAAQAAWAGVRVRERAEVARRLARLVLAQEATILDVIQAETGKNRLSAFEEVADVALGAAWLAGAAPRLLAPSRRRGAVPVLTRATSTPCPRGVVGLITPWNYPFTLPVNDALPALIAGNAVVLKPDSLTPRTARLAADLLAQAGLPDGVLQLVGGPGTAVGPALIPLVDFVQFTGSTATGRVVGELAGRHLVPYSAELGGKNPMIVRADADIVRAAEGAVRSCFANSGQLCVSIERIYVHRAVAQEFTAAFVDRVTEMRLGPGPGWDVEMGSLISPTHLAKVLGQLEDAVAQGARVLAGGRARPELGPAFLEPTVLTDVPEQAELLRAETFGPVVALTVVDSDEEALARANDTEYGLAASVWSRDTQGARAITARLRAGSVTVNESYAAAWGSHGATIGGWGDSGIGGRHGPDGLLKYTRVQVVAQQRLLPLGATEALPGPRYHALIKAAAHALVRIP